MQFVLFVIWLWFILSELFLQLLRDLTANSNFRGSYDRCDALGFHPSNDRLNWWSWDQWVVTRNDWPKMGCDYQLVCRRFRWVVITNRFAEYLWPGRWPQLVMKKILMACGLDDGLWLGRGDLTCVVSRKQVHKRGCSVFWSFKKTRTQENEWYVFWCLKKNRN